MARKPVDQLNKGRDYFAARLPDVAVDHFGALWHLYTLGHLVATDLDSVARKLGYSFADLDLMGTLAVDSGKPMLACELASALYVSNAVISVRVARLVEQGVIARRPSPADGRAQLLTLTDKGHHILEQAIAAIGDAAKIARFFRLLDPDDQRALLRILGDIHQRFDREFYGTPYRDD